MFYIPQAMDSSAPSKRRPRSTGWYQRTVNGAQRRLCRRDVSVDDLDSLIERLTTLFEQAIDDYPRGANLAVQIASALTRAYAVRKDLKGEDGSDLLAKMVDVMNHIGTNLWPEDYEPVDVGPPAQ